MRHLERSGLSRRQSVAMMLSIDALLRKSLSEHGNSLLSKSDLDSEAFAFKNGLQDTRNGLQALRQNEYAALRTDAERLSRGLEALSQAFGETLSALKSDITMDLHSHKGAAREVGTDIDLRTQTIGHRLLVKISQLKTSMEALKVELTRDIVWYSCAFLLAILALDFVLPSPPKSSPKSTVAKKKKATTLPLDDVRESNETRPSSHTSALFTIYK